MSAVPRTDAVHGTAQAAAPTGRDGKAPQDSGAAADPPLGSSAEGLALLLACLGATGFIGLRRQR